MKRIALSVVVAAMVVLAGCGATNQAVPSDSAGDMNTVLEPTSGSIGGDAGTINFYVSDEPAAIDDFEHLNVTIERIGLQKAGANGDTELDEGEEAESEEDLDADESEDDVEENETDDSGEVNGTDEDAVNGTDEDAVNGTDEDTEANETDGDDIGENESVDIEGNETDEAEMGEANETKDEEPEEIADKEKSEGWVTYEVDNRTVDLTELKGDNATRLADLQAPNGTYNAVFVYVSDVEGVLTNGETVNVKLPSEKLQLHTTFDVGPNTSTDFVYDIAVHTAGNSGKYILKPNIAESGPDVQIRDIDDDEEREDEGQMDDDEMGEDGSVNETGEAENGDEMDENAGMDEDEMDEESAADDGGESEDEANETEAESDSPPDSEARLDLSVELEGNVSAGETVTVVVTDGDGASEPGVEVAVNDEPAGQTDSEGRLAITVPEDAEEMDIKVEKADGEAELEREIEG